MLVGGGCYVQSNSLVQVALIRSLPVTGPGNIGGVWECGVQNYGDITLFGVGLEAKAICLRYSDSVACEAVPEISVQKAELIIVD